MNIQEAKKAVGKMAASFIEDGMVVGLGTGSTAICFIEALIERRLKIKTVASSHASAELAKKGGLEVLDINDTTHIDITVDGADEIDALKRMIKGGGGAHVREKILAAASREMVVIVDETKLVSTVGHTKLPIEVLFFGAPATRRKIEALGYQGCFRHDKNESLFITDNGNLIYDVHFPSPPLAPERDHEQLLHVPGVLDTGFFFGYAGRVVVGYLDGSVKVIP